MQFIIFIYSIIYYSTVYYTVYIPWPHHPPLGVNVLYPGFSHWSLRLLRASSAIRKVKKTFSTSVSFFTGFPAHLSSEATFSLVFLLLLLSSWCSLTLPYSLPDELWPSWQFLQEFSTSAVLLTPDPAPTSSTHPFYVCSSSLLVLCPLCLASACWHGPFLTLNIHWLSWAPPLSRALSHGTLPGRSLGKFCSQEVQGGLAVCLIPSSKGIHPLDLCPLLRGNNLMVPATRLLSDLQILDQSLLVCKYQVQPSTSAPCFVDPCREGQCCLFFHWKFLENRVYCCKNTAGKRLSLGENNLLLHRHRLMSGSDLLL